MPRVSVILCSYNQVEYLGEAVESVLRQTFDDWELIALDNGSTDGSLDLLRSYRDPRIKVLSDGTNVAIGKRFNQGVAAATGEFVSFLYSDDVYLEDKLAVQVAELDRRPEPFGLVYGWALGHNQSTGARFRYPSFNESGDVLASFLAQLGILAIDMLSPMTRREAFVRYPFYEDIFAEGEISYAKIAMRYHFAYLDRPFVVLRSHGGNRGRAVKKNFEMTKLALERLGAHPDFPPSAADALAGVVPRLSRRVAWQLARLGAEGTDIRRSVLDSLRIRWTNALDPRLCGAAVLGVLPTPVRRALNDLGYRLRPENGHVGVVDGYGGGS